MPQYSHMMLPSSRWYESTLRVPLTVRKCSMRSVTDVRASTTAGWSSAMASNGPSAR